MRIKKLAKIFKTHQHQLYVYAISITKNREAAEDAVHDALLAVSQTNSDITDLNAYLFSAVRNKALYISSKANKYQFNIEDVLLLDEDTTQQQVFASQVFKHLSNLNQDQEQTLIMKIFGGLTFKEIATLTQQSQNTIASWYRRGLQTLKEKINE
jgi:RNA polymerase sigma-70 factor (ECF subfamily)